MPVRKRDGAMLILVVCGWILVLDGLELINVLG